MLLRDRLQVFRRGSIQRASMTDNMVFTQGRVFVIGESFGLPRFIASMSGFGLSRRGHRFFCNADSFW